MSDGQPSNMGMPIKSISIIEAVPVVATGVTTVMSNAVPTIVSINTVKRSIPIFDGKDYAIWAFHMTNLLDECGLADYMQLQVQIQDYDAMNNY